MTEQLGIALAQINPTVGNISGNLDIIRSARNRDYGTTEIEKTGELAVSGIDLMPPGRKPINSNVFRHGSRSRAYSLIR